MQAYSQVSNARLSDAVRIGLVLAHVGDDRVRHHLQLTASGVRHMDSIEKRGERNCA